MKRIYFISLLKDNQEQHIPESRIKNKLSVRQTLVKSDSLVNVLPYKLRELVVSLKFE